jgi:hypothetical protein
MKRPDVEAANSAVCDPTILERYRHRAAGIWPLTAFLNHDDGGNVDRSFVGDALIVRDVADLPAGTELTTTYVTHDDPAAATKVKEY